MTKWVAPKRVGDVVRMTRERGRSTRQACGVCSRFIVAVATGCPSCGASFSPVSDDYAEVTGLGT